jgi:hypothetical protein
VYPARSALNRNITFTLHNDAPVTPVTFNGAFQIIWSAVNRVTISGEVLGPEQRIPVYEALKGVTINAAWQAREHETKGSIEVGKKADLVVLSHNPLTIDPTKLLEIKVLSTYKSGKLVFNDET